MQKLAALLLVILLAACTGVPYQREYEAYAAYVTSEYAAGRLTSEQAQYLVAAKENELRARSSASIQSGIYGAYPGAAIAAQGAQKQPAGTSLNCVQTGTITTCR